MIMSDPKLYTLTRRLHAKTQAGDITWTETGRDDVFRADFGQVAVTIEPRPDPDFPESPDYVISILNDYDRLVESFSNAELAGIARENEPNAYTLMQEMFIRARRTAMGLDRTLDELLSALGDEEPQ